MAAPLFAFQLIYPLALPVNQGFIIGRFFSDPRLPNSSARRASLKRAPHCYLVHSKSELYTGQCDLHFLAFCDMGRLLAEELSTMTSLNAKDRTRSPRFPSQNLQDSLRLIRMIYDGVHRSPIDAETAYRLMGFSGKTGTSAKALATLRQYGLIEGVGENTRVTDLALAILEPASEEERARSIFTASRHPEVFGSVLERFGQRVPQADEPIRAYLIRDLGFQKNSSDELIRVMRETLQFAEVERGPDLGATLISESTLNADGVVIEAGASQQPMSSLAQSSTETPSQAASIPLTRESRADLKIYGPLNERAIKNLIRAIELLADVWMDEDTD